MGMPIRVLSETIVTMERVCISSKMEVKFLGSGLKMFNMENFSSIIVIETV